MLEFARQSAASRSAVFTEAGQRLGIRPYIVEKDFWVCWMLRLIFNDPDIGGHLVFKGGTSLSKVFGIIQRFSEDIDLSVDPVWLGFDGEARPDAALSRSQFEKRTKMLEEASIAAVRERFLPSLHGHIRSALPSELSAELIFEVDEATHSPVLLFEYPRLGKTGSLRPQIKLEFGSLYDQRPTGAHSITPLTAEMFPSIFRESSCLVVALEAERTFWEKATLLHAEYHRPVDKPLPIGISRHYSDLAALSQHATSSPAAKNFDLLARVRAHKQTYFRSAWAHYETAVPGSLRLAPLEERRGALARDYRDMADMFISMPPPFEAILEELEKLELRINA